MMGGSGGFFDGTVNFPELYDKLREAQGNTDRQAFETEVSDEIAKLLSMCERDVEAVNKHLDEIKKALSNDIDGAVDFSFGGSVAKHTYVEGLSDIDALVILNNSELVGKSPKEVLGYFLDRLRGRFPKSAIDKGNLAITVGFKDIDIQLLPAVKSKGGAAIADPSGTGWNVIKPGQFQKALTKANGHLGGKLVPTIKLAKAIISCFSEKRRLTGYHSEALAVRIFKDYDGPQKPKDMLKHYFQKAQEHVKNPITDVTGQSKWVDSYLGGAKSLKRKIVVDSLGSIARRMQNADLACSAKQWREILGGL
jgi:hypothetical protein